MTLNELKKLAKSRPLQAAIVSDGCRDYVIEIRHTHGAGVLKNWRGQTRRFTSLREARNVIPSGLPVCLSLRVAADEACAGTVPTHNGFSDIPLPQTAA